MGALFLFRVEGEIRSPITKFEDSLSMRDPGSVSSLRSGFAPSAFRISPLLSQNIRAKCIRIRLFVLRRGGEREYAFDPYRISTPCGFSSQIRKTLTRFSNLPRPAPSRTPLRKNKNHQKAAFIFAERGRFELPIPFGMPVFETGRFNHSRTSPRVRTQAS